MFKKRKKKENIIIKDPLYKQIILQQKHKKFIDTKEFQRLRHIKQTSFVDFVYPSANHTRFSHSLGVYHLMNKVLNNQLMDFKEKDKETLLLAALLHDIGHGPFSHFWEKTFPHFDHEKMTQQILNDWGLKDVADTLAKKNKLSNLISSSLDVDKLDYMARDSYFTGVSYGVAEVDFIIQHCYIDKEGRTVIKPSSLSSVEDIITQRVNLFKTVYFHKFAIEYEFLFMKIFERVSKLLENGEEIFIDDDLKAFFNREETVDNLINLTDNVIIYHIHRWRNHHDKTLSQLSQMFFNRDKFSVINTFHESVDIENLKNKVSQKYDTNYFFGTVCLPIKIIQTPIYVEFESEIKKLDKVSELIKFYSTQNWHLEYVIFPKEFNK